MLNPDTVLQNRYRITEIIGTGGMGAVYLARDARLGNQVALKETFFVEEALRRAFEREARLLAGLRHFALPRVIDHFSENDGQFLVMEFIAGDDLETLLKQRNAPFPMNEVLDWADQLLDALVYLHAQDPPVIHRDIKPQNLKLAGRQIILLDFGLAKGCAAGMTQTNGKSLHGYTPTYAPLEQIRDDGTGAQSDLYALGATLYHLLTNVTPADALLRAKVVIGSQPDPLRPLHEINPEIPPAVSQVLQQTLALHHEKRPADAAQLREMLHAARNSPMAQTPEAKLDAAARAQFAATMLDAPKFPAVAAGNTSVVANPFLTAEGQFARTAVNPASPLQRRMARNESCSTIVAPARAAQAAPSTAKTFRYAVLGLIIAAVFGGAVWLYAGASSDDGATGKNLPAAQQPGAKEEPQSDSNANTSGATTTSPAGNAAPISNSGSTVSDNNANPATPVLQTPATNLSAATSEARPANVETNSSVASPSPSPQSAVTNHPASRNLDSGMTQQPQPAATPQPSNQAQPPPTQQPPPDRYPPPYGFPPPPPPYGFPPPPPPQGRRP